MLQILEKKIFGIILNADNMKVKRALAEVKRKIVVYTLGAPVQISQLHRSNSVQSKATS